MPLLAALSSEGDWEQRTGEAASRAHYPPSLGLKECLPFHPRVCQLLRG